MSDETEWVECPHCQGKKMEFPDCASCEGAGWVEDEDDGGTMTCPECNSEPCSECDGEGLVAAEQPGASELATPSDSGESGDNTPIR